MLELKRITYENLSEIVNLSVGEEQKQFVASNTDSTLHAYVSVTNQGTAQPFGIYDGNVPIGFIMFGFTKQDDDMPDCTKGGYCIWRFMIDQRYQGKGYGKEALKLGIDYMKEVSEGKVSFCWLCVETDNVVATHLYREFGFKDSGQQLEMEKIMVLEF